MTGTAPGVVDRHLGTYDVRSRHETDVAAPPEATYRAARDLDLGRNLPVALLFAIRGLPHLLTGKARPTRTLTLDTFQELGFTILEEDAPRAIVLGSIGKFWRPDSGILRIEPDEFAAFDEPGFAKGVLALSVEERGPGTSRLATETRVACTDAASRRKFLLYWRAIGPFSGVIRKLMLHEIKRAAEGSRRTGSLS